MGKWLANQWNCSFVDLDALIEEREGMQIPTIFNEKGEEYFRILESEILRRQAGDLMIVSTGGGTPCFHNNMDWMNNNGTSVYLKASPEFLLSRLKTSKNERPLLKEQNDMETFISDHLMEREPFYNKAQIVVDAMNAKKELIEKLSLFNRGKL